VRLRDVSLDDLGLYERLLCDPGMMAELGGPMARGDLPDKLAGDVAAVEADTSWICVAESEQAEAIGHVCIWTHDGLGEPFSEIGWMVLPGFQGRGVGKRAVAMLLERARRDGRWGTIHAYPAVTNAPSNGICRASGFALAGAVDFDYHGHILRCHHWRLDP